MPLLEVNIVKKDICLNNNFLPILNNVSFEVSRGEFISILGPSGCGKTTLLKIIAGLDTDYTGAVSVNGRNIAGPGLDRGMVFQDHRLMPWLNVNDNIAFALPDENKNDSRIQSIIQKIGLTGFETALPRQLSGGMAQRVALARAIVNMPDLLLLDEALGSLDDFTRDKMQRELKQLLSINQTTAVMVTHNIEEAIYLSDRILILGNKPSTITKIIEIDIDQHRDKRSEQFIRYRNQLLMDFNYGE